MSDYTFVPHAPEVDEYVRLRAGAGLTPVNAEQGAGAVAGSWAFCHFRHSSGALAAMGRVIGDGGWYFLIADMATDPAHQRQGLGRRVLEWLLADIKARAPKGAYVTLVADPPGQKLYSSVGMHDIAPSKGMSMWLRDEGSNGS